MRIPTEADMQAMRERLEIRDSSLWWKKRYNPAIDMTKPAGTKDKDGYQVIRLTVDAEKRSWKAHRVAYFLHNGAWPNQMIDHKDQDKQNNDPENLRLATKSMNEQNKPAHKNSKTGLRGVYKTKCGYNAQLEIQGKTYNKHFPTLQEAIEYRKHLEKTYHPWSPSVI